MIGIYMNVQNLRFCHKKEKRKKRNLFLRDCMYVDICTIQL